MLVRLALLSLLLLPVAACEGGDDGTAGEGEGEEGEGDGTAGEGEGEGEGEEGEGEGDVDCAVGSVGCACFADGSCAGDGSGNLLLCDATTRLCKAAVDDSASPGRPSLECYTPCQQSLTFSDGTFRFCSAEGLMAGCLAGLECVDGSCVGAGELPPSCANDAGCPAHQACLSGFCLSNCDTDADCDADADCFQKVCRTRCSTNDVGACGSAFVCSSVDGTDGVCIARDDEADAAPETGDAAFAVDPVALNFSNIQPSGSFTITNPGDRPATLTVARKEHVEVDATGRTVVTDDPLFWLEIGATDEDGAVLVAPSRAQSFDVRIDGGASVTITIDDAFNQTLDLWEGTLSLSSSRLGEKEVWLGYTSTPDGQWTGTSYYFIDFDDRKIGEWATAMRGNSRSDKIAKARVTQNALLVAWTEFRTNPLITSNELRAVIQSASSGSWAFSNVHDACRALFAGTSNAECYLYVDPSAGVGAAGEGLKLFTDSTDVRIPQGVMEMPFVVRLEEDTASTTANTFRGRVETPQALQYPGLPAASLVFKTDPRDCEQDGEACLVSIKSFDVETVVGGRAVGDDCDAVGVGFEGVNVPWLLPDFQDGTTLDGTLRVRRECRETRFPTDPGVSALNKAINKSLASGNPIPDGRVRRRTLTLLDGVLINQDEMVMLVKETFTANLAPPAGTATPVTDFSAYAIVYLQKDGADLTTEQLPYTPGVAAAADSSEPEGLVDANCDEDLVDELLNGQSVTGRESKLAKLILDGIDTAAPPAPVSPSRVHYLCHATGRFDGGRSEWQATGGEGCPAGSGVTFFLFDGDRADITDDDCQGTERCSCVGDENGDCIDVDCTETGACADVLSGLVQNKSIDVVNNLPYQCDTLNAAGTAYTGVPDTDRGLCHDDRFDLRTGKLFYDPTSVATSTTPSLQTLVEDAFRYKTRFQNRTSTSSVGFVPAICDGSESLPYCYDPEAINQIRDRVTCLVSLFSTGKLDADTTTRSRVQQALSDHFSFSQPVPFGPTTDGFERLYAELLVMLGDEALTEAVGSRFDLAESAQAGFRGDLLEPGGVQLSGGAGHQMVLLYRSRQYFQLALDRFNTIQPALWQGLDTDDNGVHNFLSLDSISTYFNRLILASTKKARVGSEIAKRYQALGRADLARHVIERAYTEAYLESITLSELMRRSQSVLDASQIDALQVELTKAQRQYRQALEGMREVYQGITDELTFFGVAPDFIPFPGEARFDLPAPRQMLERAFESLQIAKERENRALESTRSFDVDSAQFQAELSRIRQQFEGELIDVCGSFEGSDGVVYPAISLYADKSNVAAVFGDPCGLMGNGQIADAMLEVQSRSLDLKSEVADIRAVFERVKIEQQRVQDECAGRVDIAAIGFDAAGERITLQSEISDTEHQISAWEKKLSVLDRAAQVASAFGQTAESVTQGVQACTSLEGVGACATAVTFATIAGVAFASAAGVQSDALDMQRTANNDITNKEDQISDKEKQIADLDRDAQYASAIGECCLDQQYIDDPTLPVTTCNSPGPLLVNSQAQVDNLLLDLLRGEVEARRAEVEVQRALGRLASLRNQAKRLAAQQEETEDNLINVEAARNDPNIRIYANADVLSADRAFEQALIDAFKATRTVEYYTAQSYADKGDLFLVRMAGRGEDNLEDYLLDLQRDFNDFEQDFGTPSPRVHLLSFMDDVLAIPKVDESGKALTTTQRNALFRAKITDPALLDDNGYIRIPFSTSLDLTSPITAIHKLTGVEIELHGTDVGDRVGRVYLSQRGTSTIRDLDGGLQFHRGDPITAVVNTFFNGSKPFADESYYLSGRMKDRAFVNSRWELVLNTRDEAVNADLNPASLSEIRVFFFFEDFVSGL